MISFDGVQPSRAGGTRSRTSANAGVHYEIEAKFLIEDDATLAQVLDALRTRDVRSISAEEIVDRYWDTPDWRLLREGWTFRWRDEPDSKSLGLKSTEQGHGAVRRRREVQQGVVAFPGRDGLFPPGPVRDELMNIPLDEFRELFRIRNHRRLFDLTTPLEALIEIAIDQATIVSDNPSSGSAPGRIEFVELELELLDGPEESLRQLAGDMRRQSRILPSRLSKFDRGLQAAGLSLPAEIVRHGVVGLSPGSEPPDRQPLSPTDPAIRLAYRCLQGQFERMLFEEPKAWEGLDPGGVHKMRVANRRLRVAFRSFAAVLPARPVRAYDSEFKRTAAVLGEVRDLDVHLGNLERYTAGIAAGEAARLEDYRKHLLERRRSARTRLVAFLESRRYCGLKDRFARFLKRGPSARVTRVTDAPVAATVADVARRLVTKRYGRVLRDRRAIGQDTPDESYHELRIRCRRLRYLLEFFRPAYGEALEPAIGSLKDLQGVLGEFQDACVAAGRLREYADRLPESPELCVLEQLVGSQRQRAEGLRRDFGDAWKRFDIKGRREKFLAVFAEPPPTTE